LSVYHVLSPKKKISSFKRFHWHFFLAGLFLAAHFITWIASLQMTTIAHSIFLESTHPIFAIIVSFIFLKEYPLLRTIPSFILALLGMFLIVYIDFGAEGTNMAGDLLAISSALFLALYLMIARFHRTDQDLIKYLIYVYGSAAIICAIYIVISDNRFWDYPMISWMMIILLAIGPNLIGHSLLNWSSRQIEIFKVNLTLQLEPVLATMGGMIFFLEYPSQYFYSGAFLILFSIGYLFFIERK
jgi:drug/metabolite transporter (DMT)-like permease